jgi:hypothetical protein
MIKRLIILFLFLEPLAIFAQNNSLIYQVHFDKNKYELSVKNKEILALICDSLIGKTNYILYINGHTDSDADSSYNQNLSMKRSFAVRKFLIKKGIDEAFLRTQAMGEEQPLIANTAPLEKAKNRRVELLVLFQQNPVEKIIEVKNDLNVSIDNSDTTITLYNGYKLILSKHDYEKNSACLRVKKSLSYKFNIKENWLKKHIGFKNYKKVISYEPHYEFYVVACRDSCFKKPIKLFIPQYQAIGLNIGVKYLQKQNDKNGSATLAFKKIKLGDSAYYKANINCPGMLRCGTDNRCGHPVNLYAKNNISIISYSYNVSLHSDSLVEINPENNKMVTENYQHTFFRRLNILYKGDTITLKNIPIDVFAHGCKKIKTLGSKEDKSYFLFIPYRKRHSCGHYKKYKIRAKDIENLKHFDIQDLEIETEF